VAVVVSTLRIITAPKSRGEVIRTLAAQMGPMRVQPGCLRCDLYRDVEDPGAITLVEEWGSQGELDLRLRSEEYPAVLAATKLAQAQPVIHFNTVTRRGGVGDRRLGQRVFPHGAFSLPRLGLEAGRAAPVGPGRACCQLPIG
jgi:quinol monooxygenase YgiN